MSIKRRTVKPEPTSAASEHTEQEEIKSGRHPLLQGQHLDVYYFIQTHPNCTREDVSRGTGIKSSTCTARIKELIDEGFLVEPPGIKKRNRSGINARVLHISERKTGGKPLDRVRIEIILTIDANGHYGAEARVIEGLPQTSEPIPIKKSRITLTAPHPNTYASSFAEGVTTISKHELQAHAEDIIDVDYEEL